jgi:hypothetical protein
LDLKQKKKIVVELEANSLSLHRIAPKNAGGMTEGFGIAGSAEGQGGIA